MNSNNTIFNKNNHEKNNKLHNIKVAWISGICVIIAAIIGIININVNVDNKLKDEYENLKSENLELQTQLDNLKNQYDELNDQYANLEKENNTLDKENSSLENELKEYSFETDQYNSLLEENKSLKEEIEKLQNELKNSYNNEDNINIDSKNKTPSSGKKISVFELETFRGDGGWCLANSEGYYTDTYDKSYSGAYFASHYSNTRIDGYEVVIYLLNGKYSMCEGKIAWSKICKDLDGSAWIEFYSDDECIYTTEVITADDEAIDFNFSVEGVKKLTIVKNGTRANNVNTSPAYIIYPYLNLVE